MVNLRNFVGIGIRNVGGMFRLNSLNIFVWFGNLVVLNNLIRYLWD